MPPCARAGASWSRSRSRRAAAGPPPSGATPTARRPPLRCWPPLRRSPENRAPRARRSSVALISAEMVKTLRDRTGAGMMDCKRVLADAKGDMERAAELLRERGLAKAVKREGRATREGAIATALDGAVGGMGEGGCATDVVARPG